MNQDRLKSDLVTLERKINFLLGEYQSLKKQVGQLEAENADLKELVRNKEEQIDHFQNKIKISKIVRDIDPEGGDTQVLKRQIDEYIKEIDKCIAHLSK